ncbi:hypothetical protein BDV96DRAFT_660364 [Lophiotrema nucula]|uniref:Uncharacterized protein n=1 Tax=Lophiotrema nucula TaxID=690887 RepID=A0A6A5Z734_9PLEO|nr:hypothetical protein BDV96DRAFT_660364 [Lophiotrema nucula]
MTHYAVWRLGGVLPASVGGQLIGPCWGGSPPAPSLCPHVLALETIDAERVLPCALHRPLHHRRPATHAARARRVQHRWVHSQRTVRSWTVVADTGGPGSARLAPSAIAGSICLPAARRAVCAHHTDRRGFSPFLASSARDRMASEEDAENDQERLQDSRQGSEQNVKQAGPGRLRTQRHPWAAPASTVSENGYLVDRGCGSRASVSRRREFLTGSVPDGQRRG